MSEANGAAFQSALMFTGSGENFQMNFHFNTAVIQGYKNTSQQIRVMSELWVAENVYCPSCGNPCLQHLGNNQPVADYQCEQCGEIYELKSQCGKLGSKIMDGAYSSMIDRITSMDNPDLFVMQYTKELCVNSLIVIPKFFFVPSVIEKRKPLAATARRAGWVGCNILFQDIPSQGRIPMITNQQVHDRKQVVAAYQRTRSLVTDSLEKRSWLLDVLRCVNQFPEQEFTLKEAYSWIDILSRKYPRNNNIEAKIRQQLQLLRDKGFIEFLGKGQYRKI